ncbi:MAG: periplasmic heavy metal sensor [Acidobacteriota bacterium]
MSRHWLRLLPLLLLLSIGLNVGLLVGRGTPPRGGGSPDAAVAAPDAQVPPRVERMVRRMADELSLAGDDRERFFDVQRQFFARSFAAREQTRRTRRALHDELRRPDPDRARAEALLAAMAEAQRDVEAAFIVNYFETRALLQTPQQQRLFLRFIVRVRQLRQEMERRQDARPGARRPAHRDRPAPN